MRKIVTTVVFLLICFVADAQKNKVPSYFYTRTSQAYLTDEEVDDLFYNEATRYLIENGIPDELVEKTYPQIKQMLVYACRQGIILAFKKAEKENKIKPPADENESGKNESRELYLNLIRQEVRTSFSSKSHLSKYASANNSDRITFFKTTVRVGTDGKLLVQEDITINNGNGQFYTAYNDYDAMHAAGLANDEIKRGIVRAFPLYYVNKNKLFQNTTFKLISVLKDGQKENYHTENQENGILVFTGSSDVFLKEGSYSYSIVYETDHQLKMLKSFDELYWNVTGNGWSFRIDSAMCTIILPPGANMLSSKCYTGAQGSSNEDCSFTSSTKGDSTVIVFKTTRPLLPRQGITVATSWQKGIVSGPSFSKQVWYYIWNNKAVFFLPVAALLSALISFLFWMRYGRDPEKGAIVAQFEPPAGFSPAALGYIIRQKFDQQLTAASIVDAAVRNKIKIDVERDGLIFKHNEYVISKSTQPEKPPASKYMDFENEIKRLVGTRIEKGKYNSSLGSLNTKVETYLDSSYKNKDGSVRKNGKGFFSLNRKYLTVPILICMVAAGWGFFGGVVRAFQLSNFWQIAYFAGGFFLCVIVLRIFAKLLSAYNPEGRLLADKIEGFRMFLAATDEHRFDTMNPPEKTLWLYEKYLPFAIALDCENAWGKKFEDIIKTAILTGAATSTFTQNFSNDHGNLSSSFSSSFSGAISSASSPPSSSSDGGSSFGGGSSGGGGGGGGGGGW